MPRRTTRSAVKDASEVTIERVEVHCLRVPLQRPYRLAFGDLLAFDTLLVELTDRDGRTGFGEATIVTGYTEEVTADSWRLARELAGRLTGSGAAAFAEMLTLLADDAPFTATAFLSALDMLQGHPALVFDEPVEVPLLAILQGDDVASLEREFDTILADGYRTVKVKVGLRGSDDVARIRMIQSVVRGRAQIRIDANQAFSASEAVAFLKELDPQDIELFEQPCHADDLDAHRVALAAAAVPLMLDESIYGLQDIERVGRERLAAFVKVKLMKMGSLDRLVTAIERIEALGMRAVLGNGVACDPGCWMEACVAARHIDNAGEMNGFLKTRAPLLQNPLRVERGRLVIDAGYRPSLDRDALKRFAVAE